ncbi:MAG: hypothetical protein LUQ65_07970 [Candidatus Helarchaeota archaeon]|nr:hypothetical protein [Candidatus Helarchaeota archaeon]
MEAIVKDDLKKEEKKNIATASERPLHRFRLHYCPFWYPFYCRLQPGKARTSQQEHAPW